MKSKVSPQFINHPGTETMIAIHNSRSFLKASVGKLFSNLYRH